MSFVVGDEIVTQEVPVEIEPILNKLKANTRKRSEDLMNTIAFSDKFIAYVIPGAGMVLFADELTDDRKVFRYLISNNGELFIDNKQRRGEMFCPLFGVVEEQVAKLCDKAAETVTDDKDYRIYSKFMPKIVESINNVLINQPEIFSH